MTSYKGLLVTLLFALIGLLLITDPTDAQRPGRFFNRRYKNNGFNFGFRTKDGNARHEIGGFFDNPENPNGPQQYRVHGAYQYVDSNNQLFRVNYVADEKGYQPTIEKVVDVPVPTTTAAPAPGQPKVVEETLPADDDEEGGLLDDRIGPNLVKSLVG